MYRGLIAAAGLSTRLQDLSDQRNKVLLDLGGETILATILRNYASVGIAQPLVAVGLDAHAVRQACQGKAECLYNPFFSAFGILSSVWLARPQLEGHPFLFTTGDHYFTQARLEALLADQPEADILVDVAEDVRRRGHEGLRQSARQVPHHDQDHAGRPDPGRVHWSAALSAEGSNQLFSTLEKQVWHRGIQGYVADILCDAHAMGPGLPFQQRPPPHRDRFPLRFAACSANSTLWNSTVFARRVELSPCTPRTRW